MTTGCRPSNSQQEEVEANAQKAPYQFGNEEPAKRLTEIVKYISSALTSISFSSSAAMSTSLHLTAKNVPGYGTPDGSCLSLSGFSQRPAAVCVSPCSSHGVHVIFPQMKIRSTGTPSFICMVNSGGHRPNSYSRQGRQGFSRSNNRNLQNEERNMDEDDDDDEELPMSSKNGPSFNSKSQATAVPGEREKEIIELFKKVQILLRERSGGVKADKKAESSQTQPQGKPKETETVGSLLNLLRKHSKEDSPVEQRKHSSVSKEDSPEQTWGHDKDKTSSNGIHSINKNSNGTLESVAPPLTRPPSSFRKRSPFSRVTMPPPPVDSSDEEEPITSKSRSNSSGSKKDEYEVVPDAIHEPEDELGSEMLLAELDDDEDSGEEDEEHEADDEVEDLSSMKIMELKQLAKARGIKRYSKMNKSELVDVLRGSSSG
ncbi:Rho-N domain-containing protein 1, chloroplastic [Linum perenne]